MEGLEYVYKLKKIILFGGMKKIYLKLNFQECMVEQVKKRWKYHLYFICLNNTLVTEVASYFEKSTGGRK